LVSPFPRPTPRFSFFNSRFPSCRNAGPFLPFPLSRFHPVFLITMPNQRLRDTLNPNPFPPRYYSPRSMPFLSSTFILPSSLEVTFPFPQSSLFSPLRTNSSMWLLPFSVALLRTSGTRVFQNDDPTPPHFAKLNIAHGDSERPLAC